MLVVTYGRSGSTLLQGLLNSIPGYYIRGENSNFCWGLYKSYQSLVHSMSFNNDKFGSISSPSHPWFGVSMMDESEFLKSMSHLACGQLLDSDSQDVRVRGFKEISYISPQILQDFDGYLGFLQKIFPDVGFVFNVRDNDAVANSGWWKNRDPEQVKKSLRNAEKTFEKYVSEHPENSTLISYEGLLSGVDAEKLYGFLGESFDKKSFERVIGTRHSY
ncbi:sulfotransferase [Microbulbifer agarilyticus]|uniref:sulfotransferase n=1 Tax=Microbulbifer agarilyticus TaxID=260552 RepID=UPI0028F3EF0A|nr:sulfotransferase [Microbulbifer agarilyticus]